MAQTQTAPLPGQFFDVPGVGGGTQWTDQRESTVGLVTATAQAAQVTINGVLPFKQTDVVCDWLWSFSVAQTYTPGTSTLTSGVYAPWQQIGPVKLGIQNQYNSVDVESGIDLYIFNLIRPWRASGKLHNVYAAPLGFPAGGTATGYEAAANAQPNLITPAQWTNALTSWSSLLRLPASITFDVYYDLAVTGEPMAPPHRAIVSPQYMAGSTRIISPQVTLNAGYATSIDNAAVSNGGAGTATAAVTYTSTFKRKAIYAANPALLPPVYAWQYRWRTSRFNLNGVSVKDLPLPPDTGQLLMVYIRLFDPSAQTSGQNVGNAIALSAVTRVNVQYGSGLFAFDGTAAELQADFLDKHGVLLPPGVLCLDLMIDETDVRSNKRALNTLTTAGILVHLEFSGPTSATAYAVMGTESLVYVA